MSVKSTSNKDANPDAKESNNLGYVVSPLPDYPGRIFLPVPFTGRDFERWSRTVQRFIKDADYQEDDRTGLLRAWTSAAAAVRKWELEGFPSSIEDIDLTGMDVPVPLIRWVVSQLSPIVNEALDLKD